METQYWIILLIVVVGAAFASWKVVTRAKYKNTTARNNSIAAGRDVKIKSHERNNQK